LLDELVGEGALGGDDRSESLEAEGLESVSEDGTAKVWTTVETGRPDEKVELGDALGDVGLEGDETFEVAELVAPGEERGDVDGKLAEMDVADTGGEVPVGGAKALGDFDDLVRREAGEADFAAEIEVG